MGPTDGDSRYREQWPTAAAEREHERARPDVQVSASKRAALRLLTWFPWLAYLALVVAAGWFVMFDGDSSTDTLGWTLLALALPCLFVAAHASRWQRRRIDARFNAEMWAHGPSGGGGGFLDWLGWP